MVINRGEVLCCAKEYVIIMYNIFNMNDNVILLNQLETKKIPNTLLKHGLNIQNEQMIKIKDERKNQNVDRQTIVQRLLKVNFQEKCHAPVPYMGEEETKEGDEKREEEETKKEKEEEKEKEKEKEEETKKEEEKEEEEKEKEEKENKEKEEEKETKKEEEIIIMKKPKKNQKKAPPPPPVEGEEEQIIIKTSKKKMKKEEDKTKIDLTKVVIGNRPLLERLPSDNKEKIIIKASTYYMNNRKLFISTFNTLFKPYKEEIKNSNNDASCENTNNEDFKLLTHQKIVRDYLNLYTPYRGLLLYFSLGSGKTCTSIAIAEGMKSEKQIVIMTPASLKMNFFSEIKKCGDEMYKKKQYWEFISTDGYPEYVNILHKTLHIPVEFIKKNKGAWLVDVSKLSNFDELNTEQKNNIDEQLNLMIRAKYIDINYNGLNKEKIKQLTNDNTINPFDNKVVIIDEAHNFVSRIVNKLPKNQTKSNATNKKSSSISIILYEHLMNATNARIVLLTGTPIINYPNEIAVLFNILRGYIKTWTFPVNVNTEQKVNKETILEMFSDAKLKTYDYVEYSGNKLVITRNPYGFINVEKRTIGKKGGKKTLHKKIKVKKNVSKKKQPLPPKKVEDEDEPMSEEDLKNYKQLINNVGAFNPHGQQDGGANEFEKYKGIKLDETGNMTDGVFESKVKEILAQNNMDIITGGIQIEKHKCLPDNQETFFNLFIEDGAEKIKNEGVFKKRILGLTSYFRSVQEKLLPRFVENENGGIFHIVRSEMSEYQFGLYEKIRQEEETSEKNNKKRQQLAEKKGNELLKISSTYRIFSRACCNFAFPNPPGRPMPNKLTSEIDESDFNAEIEENGEEEMKNEEEEEKKDEILNYEQKIKYAMEQINQPEILSENNLQTYSPKFVKILQNLKDPSNEGLHLLYSFFRSIEGIGILKLILQQNGFAEFKIHKTGNDNWEIDEKPEDMGKPKFVLYTGTETSEEKEIIRNIYNSAWNYVPRSISTKLFEKSNNNFYGEIIKVLMITASGAEGINLKNTRFVHIVEPYWHLVRIEQVVGRARRICSHEDLPEIHRTVKVFLYLSTLSEKHKTDEKHIELRIRDVSRINKTTPITTDETLFEISTIKDRVIQQLLKSVKETSIDCSLYSANNAKENLVCYGYGSVNSNQFGSFPSLEQDLTEKDDLNVKKQKMVLKKIKFKEKVYKYDENTNFIYDVEDVKDAKDVGANIKPIGKLMKQGNQFKVVFNDEE